MGHAVGEGWRLGRLGDGRLDVEVVAQQLDRRLQTKTGLGVVDLGPPGTLADLVERTLGGRPLGAEPVEAGGEGAHLFALATAALGQLDVVGVDDRAMGVDERGEAVEREQGAVDLGPSLLGRSSGRGIGLQPPLDVGEAVLQELLPLGQPGCADVEIAPPAVEHDGAGVELGARLLAGSDGVGLGGLPCLEIGEQPFQFADALAFGPDVGRQLVDVHGAAAPARPRPGADRRPSSASAADASVSRASFAARRPLRSSR